MDHKHGSMLLLLGLWLMFVTTYGQTSAPSNVTQPMMNGTHPTSMPSNVTRPKMNGTHPSSMPSNVTHHMMNGTRPTSMPSNVTRPKMNGTHPTSMPSNVTRPKMNGTHPSSMPSNVTRPMMNGTRPTSKPSNVTRPMMNGTRPTSKPSNVTRPMMNGTRPTSMPSNVTHMMNTTRTTKSANVTQQTTKSTNGTTQSSTKTTAKNNTTSNSNTTAAPATTKATTAPATTTTTAAPPIVANTTVETLTTAISRDQCGSQLCGSEPADCDPSSSASQCIFVSTVREASSNFGFGLSGESDGFLSCTLTPANGAKAVRYICANNNGKVKLITAEVVNGVVQRTPLRVNRVKGRINGKKIQCRFFATVPNATARATDTQFAVSVETGSYNATSDSLGTAQTQLQTPTIDIANTSQNITNLVTTNTTTAAPTTVANTTAVNNTATAIPLEQSMSNGLLIIFGAVSLLWL